MVILSLSSGLSACDEEEGYTAGPRLGGPSAHGDAGNGPNVCEELATPPLRRLNRREYLNTVSDLLPGLTLPSLVISEDPRPYGFDNDATALVPSPVLIDQYHAAAGQIAEAALDGMSVWAPCGLEEEGCLEQIVREFGRRVFRRPLTEREVMALMSLRNTEPGNSAPAVALELILQTFLQAPKFLYRPELSLLTTGELDSWEVASRLSYFLWSSMPDDELFAAAEEGRLGTAAEVEAQARRMLDDPRVEETIHAFYTQWMEVDRLYQITKDEGDGFDDATRDAMREETERFVYDILFRGEGTVADLLTSRTTTVNTRLAELYGLPPVPEGEWMEVELDETRAGFLTQLAFLAGHGHPTGPSPVLRGHFILKRLLCLELGPPPPGAESAERPTMGDDGRLLTNRESYDLVTSGAGCSGCHSLINPLGFGLENFDTMGRYRELDQGQMVDASGSLPLGAMFTDAASMAREMASDPEVGLCVSEAWLRYAYAGGEDGEDSCVESQVGEAFAASGYNLRELLVHIVTQPQFFSGRQSTALPTEEGDS